MATPSNSLAGIDPILLDATVRIDSFLRDATNGRVGLSIIESWRSSIRQQELYAQGRERPGPIVTDTLKSKHLVGKALDVTLELDGSRMSQDLVPRDWWSWISRAYSILSNGRVRSGSSWGDFTHIEVT